MKKHHLFSTVMVVMLFAACQSPTNPIVEEQSEVKKTSLKDTISLATYEEWVGGWKKYGKDYIDTSLIEAFTMPLIDLSEFSTEPHAWARTVFGLDTTVTPYVAHMVLIGVDTAGNNMLPGSTYPDAHIYDVMVPCPPFCGKPPKKKKKN